MSNFCCHKKFFKSGYYNKLSLSYIYKVVNYLFTNTMKAKQSMDLLGEALKAHSQGDRSKFYFEDASGELFEHDLSRYFRKTSQLSKLERKLISLSYGDILDVGCGTCNYISLLAKKGKVVGIDISSNIIDLAKKNGCKNCKVVDIFNFQTSKKYDTITFLENNLGIGGNLDKTKKLLKKISNLLKNDGQILGILRRIPNKKYVVVELKPVWKKKVGPKFCWIHININFLSSMCEQAGLCLKVLQGNQHSYLVKIVKNNLSDR